MKGLRHAARARRFPRPVHPLAAWRGAAGSGVGREAWAPTQCSLPDPNRHSLMGPEDWDGLGASPEDLRASRAAGVAPAGVERAGRLEFAVWVATRNVCDAKTLDACSGTVQSSS